MIQPSTCKIRLRRRRLGLDFGLKNSFIGGHLLAGKLVGALGLCCSHDCSNNGLGNRVRGATVCGAVISFLCESLKERNACVAL